MTTIHIPHTIAVNRIDITAVLARGVTSLAFCRWIFGIASGGVQLQIFKNAFAVQTDELIRCIQATVEPVQSVHIIVRDITIRAHTRVELARV